jgi:hypothetical protein
MNIFVKSRGHEQPEDYQWHHVAVEREEPIDSLVPAPYEQYALGRLISAEDESYVLGRFKDRLALLITSIPSASREDFFPRPVRDSLLWLGSYADEAVLRGIIARALSDARWLPTLLDQTISFDEKQRFKVQRDVFAAALDQNGLASTPPDLSPRIRRLTETSRRELGDELYETRLPTMHGLLVVVTTIQSLQKMADAGIWRGLAQGTRSDPDWDK